tara:strand:+ start:1804 stop:2076 length:273 start_codon:yes stop_codon:yes gene_type:complete
MPCTQTHSRLLDEDALTNLTRHQMHDQGRHKCCQCAYNSGYQQGLELQTNINLDIESLGNSQAFGDGRHKSVHQAFAIGYSDGVRDFIEG